MQGGVGTEAGGTGRGGAGNRRPRLHTRREMTHHHGGGGGEGVARTERPFHNCTFHANRARWRGGVLCTVCAVLSRQPPAALSMVLPCQRKQADEKGVVTVHRPHQFSSKKKE